LSENSNSRFNLAPFSYFNAVCNDPPLLMLSVGKKPNGTFKDTAVNIEQRQDFVVHIAHLELLELLNQTSATWPAEVSEVDELAVAVTPFSGSRLPRLAQARVAYACELYRSQELTFGKIRQLVRPK
jgi:flavin reductase (DIM6/NTAB) family NADH-FMN oxidoreductase RutF